MILTQLDQYLALDLSDGSVAKTSLIGGLANEVQQPRLALTEVCATDGTPPYLTANMNGWYNQQIQPLRRAAVQDLVTAFRGMLAPDRSQGIFVEYELDQVELRKFGSMAHQRQIFETKTPIAYVHNQLQVAEQKYRTWSDSVKRDAEKWNPYRYYGIIFVLIFIFEGLINFESFLSISGFTPALSTGSFLVASTAYAVSAHLTGMILKQWKDRFGPTVSQIEKMKNRTLFIFAIVLFCLSFTFVIYARWALFEDIILRRSRTTGEGVDTEDILKFGGTLLGNVIVYVVGIVVAFFNNDSLLGFGELRYNAEVLKNREMNLLRKYLAAPNERHLEIARREREKLRETDTALVGQLPDYQKGRDSVARLVSKDAQVLGLLNDYKRDLLTGSGAKAIEFIYRDVSKVAVDNWVVINSGQYSGEQLSLRYN